MKAYLVALLVFGAATAGLAQSLPAVYLNAHEEETVPDSATHYRIVDRRSGSDYPVREYNLSGTLRLRGTLSNIDPPIRNGLFTWYHPNGSKASQVHYRDDEAHGVYVAWYEDGHISSRGEYEDGQRTGRWVSVHRNGQKRSTGAYVAGRQHGEWRYYFDNGQLSAVEQFNHGHSLAVAFYKSDGSVLARPLARRQAPEFPGGEAALLQHLARATVYPKSARRKNISGKVYVTYTVGEDGRVGQVRVVRGLAPEVDNEARRIVANLPAFRPGREYNVPTAMTFTLPIIFGPSFSLFGEARPLHTRPIEARAGYPDESY
ncbi:TonB family protein [Hymenobacter sp. BT175]|uniref:TonB family protein n=1 Tax=Hymenobacter translucens TaxID=2886507 RepID=UPI001D0E5B28|nr:TonB family protein [Hymenobacter translucens]MCC2546890.1 TonB family protein [Hymenobacter translucens]